MGGIVSGGRAGTIRPSRRLAAASSARAGSHPITRMSGRTPLAATRVPLPTAVVMLDGVKKSNARRLPSD